MQLNLRNPEAMRLPLVDRDVSWREIFRPICFFKGHKWSAVGFYHQECDRCDARRKAQVH